MENLADLEKKYEELGKEIERLKGQQNNGRVEEYEAYYCISDDGDVFEDEEDYMDTDDDRYELGNYFKTKKEAEKTLEKIKIYTELKRLAERLNNGRKIDWNNCNQTKYYIEYYHHNGVFLNENACSYQKQGTIYCLDCNFKSIAIKEIGEDKLKKLFE